MKYVSTRGGTEPKNFLDILLEGLAPDGGLYVPEDYPEIDLDSLRGASYTDVALAVFTLYATDIPFSVLRDIVERSYTAEVFGSKEITPLKMFDKDLGLLQLSNGPTLAFKDVPLQSLGNLMEYALERSRYVLNVLGATSGDTGSAAEYAAVGKKWLRIFMLSPFGRMSRFQQRQMYTLNESNIFNLMVNGPFDDCQSVVKEVNADADFKAKYKIGAVNSINWARIVAQIVYYVYAVVKLDATLENPITFAVPSGNFGNALAAHVASQMGAPLNVIVCTNENNVLDEFFRTGIYRVRKGSEVAVTTSPSMDISSASNFERWIYDFVCRRPDRVNMFWSALKKKGQFNVHDREPGALLAITSGMATQSEVIETIRTVHDRWQTIIDPHTAVAMKVALERRHEGRIIVAETAQPAKFADTIREAIGTEPPVPSGYEQLADLKEYTTLIDPDPEIVKQFIAAHV